MSQNYSQAGQDLFVLSLIKDAGRHYFVDVGCWLPDRINNTFLLEKNGWYGISVDILDLKKEWEIRNTPFVQENALSTDYEKLFDNNSLPNVIDYLNVDIEGNGDRFLTLKKIFESNREFKVITIEHDVYRGYREAEQIPQREFLSKAGYVLLCSDVRLSNNPFEDWWVNPKYVENYDHLFSNDLEYSEILKKL